eukprot:scaffold39503_cov191-Amphora_coffeaeformis.AAC.1
MSSVTSEGFDSLCTAIACPTSPLRTKPIRHMKTSADFKIAMEYDRIQAACLEADVSQHNFYDRSMQFVYEADEKSFKRG